VENELRKIVTAFTFVPFVMFYLQVSAIETQPPQHHKIMPLKIIKGIKGIDDLTVEHTVRAYIAICFPIFIFYQIVKYLIINISGEIFPDTVPPTFFYRINDIEPLERFLVHCRDIDRIILKIAVHDDDIVALALLNTGRYRKMLPKIPAEFYAFYPMIPLAILLNFPPGIVRAAIFDQYDLKFVSDLRNLVCYPFNQLIHNVFSPVNRAYYGDQWVVIGHEISISSLFLSNNTLRAGR
jgi:hypothetical protein